MRHLWIFTLFVGLSAHSETFIVNAENLNLRSEPTKAATILSKVKAGKKISAYTPEEKVNSEGYDWQKVVFTNYKGENISGWVVSNYLIETSLFQPYRPNEPKALTFPLIDFESAYLLTPDGKFSIVEPESVDGNYYGCRKDSVVVDNFCIQKGGNLLIAKDLILAKQTDDQYEVFRLKSDGSICTFIQESLDLDTPDFRTCSTDRYTAAYTKLAGKL